MSNPIVSINFADLKYDLYQILGLSKEASDNRIKKTFRKLVLELHPDKNKDANEELYNHVIIANQVLTNSQLRKDYDAFLDESSKKDSFLDLKKNFDSQIKEVEKFFPVKEEAKGLFTNKIDELNKKHGFNTENDSKDIMSQYNNAKTNRKSQINIPQERISNTKDFNAKFENKKESGVFGEQLIVANANNNLGTYQPNDGLATIGDYSNLYAEDTVSTGAYTSLDMAFKIQKINTDVKEKTLDQRMIEYKNQTTQFSNRNPNDFSSRNFKVYFLIRG
jgi:curved DNA-binding protein CbpA